MSHAVAQVAVEASSMKEVEEKLIEQMYPFDEQREDRTDSGWFADGTRWDWWVIGGRWDGYYGEGCNIIQIKNLNIEKLASEYLKKCEESYYKAKAETNKTHLKFLYGFNPDEITLEAYFKSIPKYACISSPVFLQAKNWHEGERMGWFGTSMATECEISLRKQGIDNIEEAIKRCKYTDEVTGAKIVVWNEPWEIWREQFYKRFIERLSPETWLVAIDYHV